MGFGFALLYLIRSNNGGIGLGVSTIDHNMVIKTSSFCFGSTTCEDFQNLLRNSENNTKKWKEKTLLGPLIVHER